VFFRVDGQGFFVAETAEMCGRGDVTISSLNINEAVFPEKRGWNE
jgi:hypothetical protein